ncbi:MAG: septum formation initiator family protein [Candidatus Omnitrophica bacterium]|nr:septum formation initiator family protein [Candidatus Omnitrophota bacterium]
MLKKFFIVLAIALAVLLILCWIYLPSITRYRELKSEADHLNQKIQEIDAQIKTLADERHLLQTDVAYLEKVIREELGFVKPGEIVYELVSKKNPSNPPRASSVTSITPDRKSTSVAKFSVSEKARMSPRAVAASLADTAPKGSRKKTLRSVA